MTYVYDTLSTSNIAQRLTNDEHASWYANWEACEALAEYLEGVAEDTGEPIELDTVELRCEFSLWNDLEEFQKEYGNGYSSIDDIENETTVIRLSDGAFIAGDM